MEKPLDRVTEIPDKANHNGDPGRNSNSMSNPLSDANVPGLNPSVILISPNEVSLRLLRRSVEAQRATVLREFPIYPSYAHLDSVAELECDAFVVEIDSDFEVAMDIVEAVCARKPFATVMVYSTSSEQDRMVCSMRAGAREFLVGVVPNEVLQDALVRAAARRSQQVKKVSGNTVVFWGAKGGCGVTTLASNFAIALRMETAADVALLDLNPRLGDVAVLLGLTPRFTVAEALNNAKRLDQEFLSTLVTRHHSGVSVLAAPDTYSPSVSVEGRAVGRLVDVARQRYPYVVIDAGRDLGTGVDTLLQMASTIYLVTQLDVPSLRNTQRLLSYISRAGDQRVELVINRFDAKRTEFDDERISKALGIAPRWKIPNDYAAARRTSNTGSPLIHEKSAAANGLRAMARAAAGKPAAAEKRRGLGLFS
jgi:pilus assembly protein CpaE